MQVGIPGVSGGFRLRVGSRKSQTAEFAVWEMAWPPQVP